MKALICVDMQNDFIDGALGTKEAEAIVPFVKEKLRKARQEDTEVIFTRDTHFEDYLTTQEGKKLPVEHCIKNTEGWEISRELEVLDSVIFDKITFGSVELPEYLKKIKDLEEVELIGLCTDICVISNAMLIKAAFPEITVKVDSSCCAGVTPESLETALNAMKMCQIEVL